MARNKENQKRLAKEWYERNKKLTKERSRQWALNDPDKRAISITKWREENREQHNAGNREWNSKNKDIKAALSGKRRSAKLNRTPKWLTADDIEHMQALYSVAAMIQRESGVEYHIDHIIPLQGKFVSGLHVPDNLRVIPAVDNLKKSNKHTL